MDRPLSIRERILAFCERLLASEFSTCHRCRRPWKYVVPHPTHYAFNQLCYPLCEDCWEILDPPERLPYYKQLWLEWQAKEIDVPWTVIHAACLHERGRKSFGTMEQAQNAFCADADHWIGIACCAPSRWELIPALPREVQEAWDEALGEIA
jgi:hypothetical protein